MSRFIDADAFVKLIDHYILHDKDAKKHHSALFIDGMKDGYYRIRSNIIHFPSANVVEVVRCKDCMHTEIDKYAPAECQNRCKLSQLYHEPTFFCKCGEPRTDLLEWIHRGDDDEQGV